MLDRSRVAALQARRSAASNCRLRERAQVAVGNLEARRGSVPAREAQPDGPFTAPRQVELTRENHVCAAPRSLALDAAERDVRDGHLSIDDRIELVKILQGSLGDLRTPLLHLGEELLAEPLDVLQRDLADERCDRV